MPLFHTEMKHNDYYAMLGVSRDATTREIRQAYRRLARQYHPDLSPGNPAAEEQFKELRSAVEILTDPIRRQSYDRSTALAHGFSAGAVTLSEMRGYHVVYPVRVAPDKAAVGTTCWLPSTAQVASRCASQSLCRQVPALAIVSV